MDEQKSSSLSIPVAIVIAGALIAGAIFFVNYEGGSNTDTPQNTEKTGTQVNVPAVTDEDHILGNPNADVVIVEYSDLECPYCKQFHATMHRIIDDYGRDGRVAWVYRHFPIVQLHSKAPREAEATECAAELGGNDAFWKFTDRVFEITPSNNRLDLAQLPQIAEDVGLDREAFVECFDSGKYTDTIREAYESAVGPIADAYGGRTATPFSFIIADGKVVQILPGAYPQADMQRILDSLLQ